ncbi:MAG: hypothetical protein IJP48_00500 [Synergistaceae bacterium]|nr:hypothetical protein [Synergistaceae bacterium]
MELGYNDKLFLFTSKGDKAAVVEFHCVLDVPVILEKLKEAVRMTLNRFPYFRVRPFLDEKNDALIFEENTSEVPVFAVEGSIKEYFHFGSDETNGYLFCVYAYEKENAFTVAASHVIGDVRGEFFFMRLLMYYYLKLSGCEVDPALVPYSEADNLDESAYENFCDACEKIQAVPDEADNTTPEPAFKIPENPVYSGTAYTRDFAVVWKNSEMLNAVHSLETSFVCFVNAVIAEAIYRNYDVQNKIIAAGVPVDMRDMMHSKSQLNFTNNITLNYESSYASMSMKEKTQLLRSQLKAKTKLNNLAAGAKGWNSMLDAVMKMPLNEQIKIFESMYKYVMRTFLLSNIGAVKFPDDIQAHLKDFMMYLTNLEDTPAYFLISQGENGMLLACQNYDDTKILESICDILKDYGVKAEVVDKGKFQTCRLNIERFSKK